MEQDSVASWTVALRGQRSRGKRVHIQLQNYRTDALHNFFFFDTVQGLVLLIWDTRTYAKSFLRTNLNRP